jgi:5-methylcytosine-specific restriction protein B
VDKWFSFLMPEVTQASVAALLRERRYVIIQGPPGTGKTRMADKLLREDYRGAGRTIQFHPNTTYEGFVGGWRRFKLAVNSACSSGRRPDF